MSRRSPISTHVLDLSRGRPGDGVEVALERRAEEGWERLGAGRTDGDGRIEDLLEPGSSVEPGVYRLSFGVEAYFQRQGRDSFYPEAAITFRVESASEHYHVPLLLNAYGYSTYRGS